MEWGKQKELENNKQEKLREIVIWREKGSCRIQSPESQELSVTTVPVFLITVKWLRPRMWILSIKSVEIITCVGVGVTKKHNEFEQ